MPAIQPQLVAPLKEMLKEHFVPHLLPLLGNGAAADREEKQISRAFSAFVLRQLFGLDARSAAKAVVDDYEDQGIDAIYYDLQNKTLYLIQSKLKESHQFLLGEAQSFVNGVELLLHKEFERFNQNVQNFQAEIEQALDECDNIQLIIAYTGNGITVQAQNALRQRLAVLIDEGEQQLVAQYQEFGPEQVEQALRAEHVHGKVNERIGVYKFRIKEQPRKAVFGIANLKDLVSLHNTHGRKLYEKNIRYFIGVGRRGVSKAIKDTLHESPESFLYLNNGVTIVGDQIKTRSQIRGFSSSKNFDVTGLSVVNGAQTIASAAQFVEEFPDVDISQAQVMLTIIDTGNDGFHKQVTRARNLQNPVDLSNFAALDDNQERLRLDMALFGVQYHYRPQQQSVNGLRVISIEILAKALACLQGDVRNAANLKAEPAQFTTADDGAYRLLFVSTLSGVTAINAVNAFDSIAQLAATAEKTAPSPERLVYRHFVYCIASVLMVHLRSKINGAVIVSQQEFMALISGPFDIIRQLFSDRFAALALGSAPHSYFKRLSDAARLMQGVWIIYQGKEGCAVVAAKQARLKVDDPYNQSLFTYLADQAIQL